MKLNLIISVLLLSVLSFCLYAQHKIPVGTKGNVVELEIKNPPGSALSSFVVSVDNLPEWIEFSNNRFEISNLTPGENAIARFSFDIKASAPINEEHSIPFKITGANGKSILKLIDILITPPDKIQLAQNYPNPFNPSTIIKYQIPVDSRVTIKLFDILGREVMTLHNEDNKAGVHEIEFDAHNQASGVYFYRMQAGSFISTKKMILLK